MKYHLPSDETFGQRCFRVGALGALALLVFGLCFSSCHKLCGQSVLIPAYDASTGELALRLCPPAKLKALTLIINPNSGPGDSLDTSYSRLIRGCNAKGVRALRYVGLMAFPGDGLNSPSSKEHVKTPQELNKERALYEKFYAGTLKFDGWFFDDVRAGMDESYLCIAAWPGRKVMNPGGVWVPPPVLADCIVVVSEQAGTWPRTLTAWEWSHRQQCAVMGLCISSQSLPAFMKSTAGMAYCYASPLDDKWKQGQSAYSSLTPHFGRLFR